MSTSHYLVAKHRYIPGRYLQAESYGYSFFMITIADFSTNPFDKGNLTELFRDDMSKVIRKATPSIKTPPIVLTQIISREIFDAMLESNFELLVRKSDNKYS